MTTQDLKQIQELFRSELQAELPVQFKKLFRSELQAELPVQFKKLLQSELPVQFKELFRSELQSDHFKKFLQSEMSAQLCKFTEEVLLPAIENIIDNKLEPIKRELGVLKTRYPDKDYLDDKLSDARGDTLAARKKDSFRVDEHIRIHYKRGNITQKDVEKLDKLRAFAPLPAAG